MIPEQNKEIAMPPLPEEDQAVLEESQETPQEDSAAQVENDPTPQEKNFRALRESKERAERERDEALRMMREIQSGSARNAYESKVNEDTKPEESLSIAPDDLVEGKHLSLYDKKIKNLERRIEDQYKTAKENAIENKLKSQYPDFDKVVNESTISSLRAAYPEIAATINSSSDLYNKAVSAYTLIKNLGVYKEDTYSADREIAHKNSSKPRPLSSVSPQQGDTPLSRANAFASGLTDDLRKSLLKEMADARKNM